MNSQENSQIVLGIVHPNGSGGSATIRPDYWTLQTSFYAWRDESKILHKTRLYLRKEVSHEALSQYFEQIERYKIIKVRLNLLGGDSSELLELLDNDMTSDDELKEISAELQKPKTFEHERFGIFVLDREIDWYEASVTWGDKPIKLHIFDDEASVLDATLKQAVRLWDNQLIWNQRVMDLLVLRYFPHIWLDEGEKPVSLPEFKSRLSLESITVLADGSFEFWYSDDYLFGGHWLEVTGNLDTGLQNVKLQG